MKFRHLSLLLLLVPGILYAAAPKGFDEAKRNMRLVYADHRETIYCGCGFDFVGSSGAGRTDLASCGYVIRKQPTRAQRIEWEHIVPAYNFGRQRACWREGGRSNCNRSDPIFNAMEGDMHNLSPAVGEINADRSNFNFNVLPGTAYQHGNCKFKVDFKQRAAEPREEIMGMIARIYFYMHDRYGLTMSRQQEQLLMAWNSRFPVTDWERERNERIAMYMGHSNEFVTGKRQWTRDYKTRGDGLSRADVKTGKAISEAATEQAGKSVKVLGNRRSKIYHMPGCPSFDSVGESNRVAFDSESEAVRAGYRRAGNCL